MSIVETLIRPGQTPSGFGLVLLRELGRSGAQYYLRPLSPCCGAFMDPGTDYECQGCRYSYEKFAEDNNGTIGNPVPIGSDGVVDDHTLSRWIARIMLYPNPEGNHDVKVSIKWS